MKTQTSSSRETSQIIQINQPALELEAIQATDAVLDDVEMNDIDTVIFECSGDAFSGGFPDLEKGASRADISYVSRWNALLGHVEKIKAKTCIIYRGTVGPAAFQLGLSVDIRLMQTDANLQVSGLSNGVFPGISMYRLQKFVGLGAARRLLLLGEALNADEALALGLVDKVCDSGDEAIDYFLSATAGISAEAAAFVRRVTDESYHQDRAYSLEQTKAAQFKIGSLLF